MGPALGGLDKSKSITKDSVSRLTHVLRRLWLAFCFSWVNFAKIGFGGLRLDPDVANGNTKRGRFVLFLAWTEWGLGYVWYAVLLYTLAAAMPVAGGSLK